MALKPDIPSIELPTAPIRADSEGERNRRATSRQAQGRKSLVAAGKLKTKSKTVKSSLLGD